MLSAINRNPYPQSPESALCAGLELFFTHTRPAIQLMGQLLKRGLAPADVMKWFAAEDAKPDP